MDKQNLIMNEYNVNLNFFRYCDAQGLSTPRAQCDPGYICILGAYTSTPTDDKTGSICPAGGFCTAGSYQSKPCPPTTYSNTTGATNDKDCRDCDPGYYCMSARGPSPDGPCNPGYYCQKGARLPNETETDPGFYAPRGSSAQRPCQVGTFQPYRGQGSCMPCTAGHYCDTTEMNYTKPCQPGYYCPEGSEVQQFCPAGTYNNFTRQNSSDDCTACPPGRFCGTASSKPSGKAIDFVYLTPTYSSNVRLKIVCLIMVCNK